MYAAHTANYTFVSSDTSSRSSTKKQHRSLVQDANSNTFREASTRSKERCDVHHSVAQLYLRTLPSLDALPRRGYTDTVIATRKRGKRSRSLTMSAVAMQDNMKATSTTMPCTASSFGKSPPAADPSSRFFLSHMETLPPLSSADESSSPSSTSSSTVARSLTSTELRTLLAASMSSMYRSEVPLYGDLLSIISKVNSAVISDDPACIGDDEISRLSVERHGAIRVGSAAELSLLSRIFAIFGMYPVGYYDLWRDARLPVHATAFRPIGRENLLKNPFRVFCSLLRLDLIREPTTRRLAEELLASRQIVSPRCLELLRKAESLVHNDTDQGIDGLSPEEAVEFVHRVADIFAWHSTSPASCSQYSLLAQTHPLVADIVSFRGPHINHLTPRTLDIDAAQLAMVQSGMDAKDVVEGPPRRTWAVLLRQTSFHALSESVRFADEKGEGQVEGKHKARFGEIEARGMALTRKGARLYDALMEEVARVKKAREMEGKRMEKDECARTLETVFRYGFPDSRDALLRKGLAFWSFSVMDVGKAKDMWKSGTGDASELLADMVERGALEAEPITYEDFLPASAAGIFQSNLPQALQSNDSQATDRTISAVEEAEARERLEAAVGGTILDYFALYSEQQRESLVEVGEALGVDMDEFVEMIARQGL